MLSLDLIKFTLYCLPYLKIVREETLGKGIRHKLEINCWHQLTEIVFIGHGFKITISGTLQFLNTTSLLVLWWWLPLIPQQFHDHFTGRIHNHKNWVAQHHRSGNIETIRRIASIIQHAKAPGSILEKISEKSKKMALINQKLHEAWSTSSRAFT